ncbi:SHOCT domain-containing protein [Brachybacterium sp. YJGR34]|uniref:SHOCT domain-containing protein n=1 Tax=Brachybacterium sp. YJGR34 TaxID=2059911 RepID=UPI000E0C55B4|nr:SHOCT domain-containing protein [Brachybacterium sp. YJGR34]
MPGLIRSVARTAAIAGTATHVSNNVSRRQAGRWAAQEQQQARAAQAAYAPPAAAPAPAAYAPPAPAAPAAVDTDARIAQLQQLGQLQASGVLTPEEFAAEKARILSS